jgi:hypothetical protein
MPSRKPSKVAKLAEAIATRGYTRIGEEEFRQLLGDMGAAREDVLRRLLRECGLPLAPLVEGVRLTDPGEAERTATALLREYEAAAAAGDAERARRCRMLVIAAKDRARLAARSAKDPGRRARMAEVAEWLLVWLESPAIFPAWLALRKKAAQRQDALTRPSDEA